MPLGVPQRGPRGSVQGYQVGWGYCFLEEGSLRLCPKGLPMPLRRDGSEPAGWHPLFLTGVVRAGVALGGLVSIITLEVSAEVAGLDII